MVSNKEYHKEYYKKNKEKLKANMKKHQEDNKKKIAERKKDFYKKNKDEILKQQKENYTKNRIRLTNNPYGLNVKENKKRINARAYARKKPLKSSCQICEDTQNLERHHWRYDKPLIVATLCHDCHSIQHIRNFETSKYGGHQFGK